MRDSSPLSSALSTRNSRASTQGNAVQDWREKQAQEAGRTPGGFFAKLDLSDLLAQLEARLLERLEVLEQHCASLESRVGALSDTPHAAASGFQQELDMLHTKVEATMSFLQASMDKEASRITMLVEGLRMCSEGQTSLQSKLDEVWRRVDVDHQEVVTSFRALSETLQPYLQGIYEKADRPRSDNSSVEGGISSGADSFFSRAPRTPGASMRVPAGARRPSPSPTTGEWASASEWQRHGGQPSTPVARGLQQVQHASSSPGLGLGQTAAVPRVPSDRCFAGCGAGAAAPAAQTPQPLQAAVTGVASERCYTGCGASVAAPAAQAPQSLQAPAMPRGLGSPGVSLDGFRGSPVLLSGPRHPMGFPH